MSDKGAATMAKVIALDFDGVLCDGLAECPTHFDTRPHGSETHCRLQTLAVVGPYGVAHCSCLVHTCPNKLFRSSDSVIGC